MKTWQSLLREADPLAGVGEARIPEADAMRRRLAVEARTARTVAAGWLPSAVAFAATVTVVVSAGTTAGRWMADRERQERPADAAPATGAVRQLQFSTPHGTRIIWIFNSDLNLNETTP